MTALESRGIFLVLASRQAFEAFTGPVPEDLRGRVHFVKPNQRRRIRSLLPSCRLVVSKNYPRPDLNRWIFEARHRGIPTLLLVDGPLEWSNVHANPSLRQPGAEAVKALFEPIVHDAVATIGEAQARYIESRNENRGIAYMSYANQRIRTTPASVSTPEPTQEDPAGDRDLEFDFLLTTAKTPAFDEREFADLTRALLTCLRALEDGGHRTLVRLFDEELRRTVRPHAPSARFEAEGSFRAALSRTRCVIGTPSSVLLEAMQHAKPTGILMFRAHPLFYEAGWQIPEEADWSAPLVSMLARDPERMQRQRSSLDENLSKEDFFDHCRRIAAGEILTTPRPLDALDREFQNRVLQHLRDRSGLAFWLRRMRGHSTGHD